MFKRLIDNWNKFWFKLILNQKPKPKSIIELIADTIYTDDTLIPSKEFEARIKEFEARIKTNAENNTDSVYYITENDFKDESLGYVRHDPVESAKFDLELYPTKHPDKSQSALALYSMVLKPIDYISYHSINGKQNICGIILKIEMSGGEYSEVTVNCLKDDRLLTILKNLGLPEVPLPNPECAVYYDDDPIIFSRNSDGTITRNKDHRNK